jgi:hypothetical protein
MTWLVICFCVVALTLGMMYLTYIAKEQADRGLETGESFLAEVASVSNNLRKIVRGIESLESLLGYDKVTEFLAQNLDGSKFYQAISITTRNVLADVFIDRIISSGYYVTKEWKTTADYEDSSMFLVLAKSRRDFEDPRPNTLILKAEYSPWSLENCDVTAEEVPLNSDGKVNILSRITAYLPSNCEDGCQITIIPDVRKHVKDLFVEYKPLVKTEEQKASVYVYAEQSPSSFVWDAVRMHAVQPPLQLSYPAITSEKKQTVKLQKFLDSVLELMKKQKFCFSLFGEPASGKSSVLRLFISMAGKAGLTVVKATGQQFINMMENPLAKSRLPELGKHVVVVIDEAGFNPALTKALLSATEGLDDASNVSIVLATQTEESMSQDLLRDGRMQILLHINKLAPTQWRPLYDTLKTMYPTKVWTLPTDTTKDYLLGEVYSWGKDPDFATFLASALN